jgi:hypothetical protein
MVSLVVVTVRCFHDLDTLDLVGKAAAVAMAVGIRSATVLEKFHRSQRLCLTSSRCDCICSNRLRADPRVS